MRLLFDLFFGCWHERTSRVFTRPRTGQSNLSPGSYIVCLDCGHEIPYDLDLMAPAGAVVSATTTEAEEAQ